MITVDGNEPDQTTEPISRRAALKKGVAIGGAVLWVTPVVQTIGMTSAFAQTTSGSPPGNPPSKTTLALTGRNTQHAAELGLAATAVGVALTVATRAKRDRSDDEPVDTGSGLAPPYQGPPLQGPQLQDPPL